MTDEEPEPCACNEWYCDICAHQHELKVAANPCPTCKGKGVAPHTDEPTDQERIDSLQGQVELQDGMLSFASEMLGRLEQRWRAPGAAKAGQSGIIVQQGTLAQLTGICDEDGGHWHCSGDVVSILAWCDLIPLPASDGYVDLK